MSPDAGTLWSAATSDNMVVRMSSGATGSTSIVDPAAYGTYMNIDPDVKKLLIYIAVAVTLILLVTVADLIVDWKTAHPHKRHSLKAQLVDEGIALAERTKGPSDLKLRNAIDWAMDRCADHGVKTTRNELAKLVEIRLPAKVKPPT